MSTIILPAIRKPWANLYRYEIAGNVDTGDTFSQNGWGHPEFAEAIASVVLADVGLAAGDVVSGSLDVRSVTPGESVRARLQAYDASGSPTGNAVGTYQDTQTFVRQTISAFTIPANTTRLRMEVQRQSGSGETQSRCGLINRGARAANYTPPSRGATAPWTEVTFERDNQQVPQRRLSGVTQLTTFPSRLWRARFSTALLAGDELREWELAIDQLSDIENVFRMVPPRYNGPSTGYLGADPLVNGASQLGMDLDVDGLDASTAILKAGDYCSIEVTSPGGNTNVQLFKVAADVTSNSSGEATITFTTPIRQSPANNATVRIHSPTCQMALVSPRGGVNLGALRRGVVQIEAEERVWP